MDFQQPFLSSLAEFCPIDSLVNLISTTLAGCRVAIANHLGSLLKSFIVMNSID